MPLLFSYGTLQQDDVQLATFGRLLSGQSDELPAFEQSRTEHANVTFNGNAESRVPGMAFEVTDAELERADEYEAVFSYRRVAVTLASGRQAWVYRYWRSS
jgi:gamma-glutamylcyclotransferase (GGCT)/AIG2-like uncharacterized protein YtfP